MFHTSPSLFLLISQLLCSVEIKGTSCQSIWITFIIYWYQLFAKKSTLLYCLYHLCFIVSTTFEQSDWMMIWLYPIYWMMNWLYPICWATRSPSWEHELRLLSPFIPSLLCTQPIECLSWHQALLDKLFHVVPRHRHIERRLWSLGERFYNTLKIILLNIELFSLFCLFFHDSISPNNKFYKFR
jgi:hypothetical protein